MILCKLVVLVAPSFSRAELISAELEKSNFNVLTPTQYKEKEEVDVYLSMAEQGDFACYTNEYRGEYRGITYDTLYDILDHEKTILVATLSELEQIEQCFPRVNGEAEIFAYFVTDTTEQLLKNVLNAQEEIENVEHKIIKMIKSEIYWGSSNAGRFHAILRHSTTERAQLLAQRVINDIESAIHVDQFLD